MVRLVNMDNSFRLETLVNGGHKILATKVCSAMSVLGPEYDPFKENDEYFDLTIYLIVGNRVT